MKRKANGDGSITQRKDGRWMGRYYVTLPCGTRKRQHIISKDRQTVVTRMREELALADKGTPIIRDNQTLGEYLEYWLTNISAPRVRPTTQHARIDFVRRLIIAEIGHIKLTNLKPQHVLQMLSQLEAKNKGKYTQKRAKQLLSTALKDAMKLEIIHRNVAMLVDTPKHTHKERKVWDKSQIQQFLTHTKKINHKYYPLFELLFYYGLRRGEVLGLRWQDIDFEKNEIHIRQTLAEVGHTIVFGEPKTRAGIRNLPLLSNVRETLLRHQAAEPEYADDLLFHGREGNPVYPHSLLKTFRRLCQQAGLPKISLHEIRHTVATLMKDSNVSPTDAQHILGHSDIAITLQFYTHSTAESKVTAMDALATNLSK